MADNRNLLDLLKSYLPEELPEKADKFKEEALAKLAGIASGPDNMLKEMQDKSTLPEHLKLDKDTLDKSMNVAMGTTFSGPKAVPKIATRGEMLTHTMEKVPTAQSGLLARLAPQLIGKRKLMGQMHASSPEMAQLKQTLNESYEKLGPSHTDTQFLQKLLNQYLK